MTRFSISDLEEFSGVKAHTIRVWERRYGLLAPDRTDTNIRTYGLDELKTILNVAFLNRHGLKISKIAALSPAERDREVRELAERTGSIEGALDNLKVAMVTYDLDLFERTSSGYLKEHGFRDLMERLYVPLLEHIGLLWQSNAICPAQEHFISNLVRQKLIAAIDDLKTVIQPGEVCNVLYLPENEIHELGLLYLQYLLRAKGEHVVFLGQSVPAADLEQLAVQFTGPVRFISIFTAFPSADDLPAYVRGLRERMPDDRITFHFSGSRVNAADMQSPPAGVELTKRFRDMLAVLA